MKVLRKALAAMEAQQNQGAATIQATSSGQDLALPTRSSVEARLVAEKMNALDARIAFVKEQRAQYLASSVSLKEVISRIPEVGAELANLERKRSGVQKSLDEVSDKLAKARLGERLEEDQRSERFEVIEQPIAPVDPARPNRKKYLALVLAVAFGSGGALAFATEFLDRRIRTSAELLSRLGVRPIGVIEFIPVRKEQLRKRWLWSIVFILLAAAIGGSIFAVDQYYMPLQLLYQKVLQRLG